MYRKSHVTRSTCPKNTREKKLPVVGRAVDTFKRVTLQRNTVGVIQNLHIKQNLNKYNSGIINVLKMYLKLITTAHFNAVFKT